MWQANGVSIAPGAWYQFSPRAISDGADGVIVAWVDGRNGICNPAFQAECDIFAQRINADGERLWGATGVPISAADRNQGTGGIDITSDGAGGAIIVWEDARLPHCCRIFAQRVDANGAVKWTPNGIPISPPVTNSIGPIGEPPRVVSDGAGGAIIAYFDEQEDPTPLAVQRVDANGQAIWGSGGVKAGFPATNNFAMTPDGYGGAILAWTENFFDIFAQRISDSGQILWDTDGMQVTNDPYFQWFPDLVSDGNGGAIITWGDERNHPPGDIGGCDMASGNCDIFAQRIDAVGQILWQENGIPISIAQGNQFLPQIVEDGSQGAIIAWQDCRAVLGEPVCMGNLQCPCLFGMDTFAQRIDATGQILWQPDGSPVSIAPENQGVHSGTPLNPGFFIASDGLGGAILAWPDGRTNTCAMLSGVISDCDLYTQRVTDQFPPPLTSTLAVTKTGSGDGNVTSSPIGIDCDFDCLEIYFNSSSVSLTATPSIESDFTGWSGGGCTGTDTCTVILNAYTVVTASFDLGPILTVRKKGDGNGIIISNPSGIICGTDCTQAYSSDSAVTLVADPSAGSRFAGWSGGGCTGRDTCTVTLKTDISVKATFNIKGQKDDESGGGSGGG
jgi:hypothetical protein